MLTQTDTYMHTEMCPDMCTSRHKCKHTLQGLSAWVVQAVSGEMGSFSPKSHRNHRGRSAQVPSSLRE